MSSRAEDKERRRQERLAAEKASQRSGGRTRIAIVAGGVLVAAIAVVLVLLLTGSDGDGDDGAQVAAPTFNVTNLSEAARAASCKVSEHDIEGATHTPETVEYETNPPTSGDHDPVPSEDGVYAADNPPDLEQSVHSLEHGRINFQYKAGTPQERIDQLESMADEEVRGTAGWKTLLFQNQTEMEPAVAATAWAWSITCDAWNDQVFDALRAFRESRISKGPENVP